MIKVTSTELNTRPGTVLRQAQTEPVAITIRGESTVVMVPLSQYEAMGGERSRLLAQLEKNHRQAKENGLTESILNQLLHEKQ
jgi:prevent-host-death family protein